MAGIVAESYSSVLPQRGALGRSAEVATGHRRVAHQARHGLAVVDRVVDLAEAIGERALAADLEEACVDTGVSARTDIRPS